ncbi:FxsA family protein [Campylobacter sp. VicNov18]|uniref:FxsA family protein n=1 Tax=Campylobacter bilis TaxID=2691918 RepID=UPI00130D92B6|nr:FxsA family protein [Campylobacter bilis]MPV64123.1 integral memnbrane protein [Campylobacter hepaticus]MBM0637626.1 integral memnbrane protein [Campylobacter bilis]MCC8278352.1 FxsA family protein [Campylobacter bilis]MCC8299855.1 FxsA family protein [Campylobacter bilis]MCC8301261.1 FxsA family protein [Campylobacter bilis]
MNYKLNLSPLIVLEIVLSVLFIVFFGLGNFLLFMLFSLIFGIVLLAIFWKNILEFQITDLKHMLTQFTFVIAGFLLIFPGIFTSVLGILVFVFGLSLKLMTKSKSKPTHHANSNEEIIDVEIIEDRK